MASTRTHQQSNRFAIAFALTAGIMLIEIIAGMVANSLALLSDAAHLVTDVLALGLAWFAAVQANRPATVQNTWGYHRVGIIAALLNAATLIGITLFIGIEAIMRLNTPQAVNPPLMIIAASLAIVINVVNIRILDGGHTHTHAGNAPHHNGEDLNKRAALLHLIGDIWASAAVIIGAIVIWLTGWLAADAIISVAIAALIVVSAVRIGRDAVSILLEATPRGLDVPAMEAKLRHVPGVYNVHHVHVWSLTGTIQALSCHAVIDNVTLSQTDTILTDMQKVLREQFSINHTTVQFEGRGTCQHADNCVCGAGHDCGCVADPAHMLDKTMVHSH